MLTKKSILPLVIAAAMLMALGMLGFGFVHRAAAEPNFSTNIEPGVYRNFNFFTATTTTATSTNLTGGGGYFKVAGAKHITFYFSRAWDAVGNSGSTNFKVQVSPDGTNWYDYQKLIQNVATSTYPASVSSVTISAATSTVAAGVDTQNFNFYGVRCIAVETTDGAHTCTASADF